MNSDPIVDEVRRVRQEYAAQFGYDIRRIAEDLRRQEKESGRQYLHGIPEESNELELTRSSGDTSRAQPASG